MQCQKNPQARGDDAPVPTPGKLECWWGSRSTVHLRFPFTAQLWLAFAGSQLTLARTISLVRPHWCILAESSQAVNNSATPYQFGLVCAQFLGRCICGARGVLVFHLGLRLRKQFFRNLGSHCIQFHLGRGMTLGRSDGPGAVDQSTS